jgi:hypothetical protein
MTPLDTIFDVLEFIFSKEALQEQFRLACGENTYKKASFLLSHRRIRLVLSSDLLFSLQEQAKNKHGVITTLESYPGSDMFSPGLFLIPGEIIEENKVVLEHLVSVVNTCNNRYNEGLITASEAVAAITLAVAYAETESV